MRRVKPLAVLAPLAIVSAIVVLGRWTSRPSPVAAQSFSAPLAPPPPPAGDAGGATAAAAAPSASPDGSQPALDPADADRRLKDLEQQIQKGRAERDQIKQKAQDLAKETAKIRDDMVATAHAAQENEDLLSALENQLAQLTKAETEKSEALKRRAAQMTGVLTALQRLAWRPTEALLAQPQSPADTVRSAILLRAAVPQIEQSARDLRGQLDALAQLRGDIGTQKQKISDAANRLEGEHQRLKALYERKAQVQTVAEAQQAAADARVQHLAGEAEDLRDLLRRLEEDRQRRIAEAAAKAAAEKAAREAEVAARKAAREAELAAERAAREAELAARKAEKEQHQHEQAQAKAAHEAEVKAQADARAKEAAAQQATRAADQATSEADAARPAPPDSAFDEARGRMIYPARGAIAAKYGGTDTDGRIMRGILIQTRQDAQVVAPYGGQVVFAGPFRSYGLLLIIEHSEGYHTLLAGMARIDVAVGQRLVAGEPVGVMGQDDAKPALYVELRRNGQPVNPLPWLTAQKSKARE